MVQILPKIYKNWKHGSGIGENCFWFEQIFSFLNQKCSLNASEKRLLVYLVPNSLITFKQALTSISTFKSLTISKAKIDVLCYNI